MQNNKTYTIDPNTVIFDDRYVVFNPLHNEEEFAATLESIRKLGQLDPILMLDGKCIDGRHRTKAMKELGGMVLCTDVDNHLTEEELILLCNKNVTSGRDYDSSQKAIQALNLTTQFDVKAKDAAILFKVDRRLVSYAATIRGYGRNDILEKLMSDKKNRIKLAAMERPSRSLELLAKFVKAESEEKDIVVDDSERIQWKPDAYIKSELGKAWYYEQIRLVEILGRVHYERAFAEMANLKFKTKGEE